MTPRSPRAASAVGIKDEVVVGAQWHDTQPQVIPQGSAHQSISVNEIPPLAAISRSSSLAAVYAACRDP